MQLLDTALSAPFTDLLATRDERVRDAEPTREDRNAAARARYDAMAAEIDAVQTVLPEAAARPRRRVRRAHGRRTG